MNSIETNVFCLFFPFFVQILETSWISHSTHLEQTGRAECQKGEFVFGHLVLCRFLISHLFFRRGCDENVHLRPTADRPVRFPAARGRRRLPFLMRSRSVYHRRYVCSSKWDKTVGRLWYLLAFKNTRRLRGIKSDSSERRPCSRCSLFAANCLLYGQFIWRNRTWHHELLVMHERSCCFSDFLKSTAADKLQLSLE